MNSSVETVPELARGELAPTFALLDRNHTPVTRSQFRDRRYLVLLFFTPANRPEGLLAEFARQSDRLRWLEAEVLAILPVTTTQLPGSTPVVRYLADPGLTATRRFTAINGDGPQTTVVVLDRYGAFEQRWLAPDLPTVHEILLTVERLAISCSG